ncbi:MAG: hypothetical protein AUI36_47170 [Cyanobacteria bacterium 13_1_40CM_2_61_4]|nr:MAG: hypothetical protein AUI36_47170 [Cyanobacteria bacterium 13_1_40CM_2_61_4]
MKLLVRREKISHQDPPGYSIDYQVMDDQQQTARSIGAEIEMCDTKKWPLRKIQAALQVCRLSLDSRSLLEFGQRR